MAAKSTVPQPLKSIKGPPAKVDAKPAPADNIKNPKVETDAQPKAKTGV